ncbi:MAG: cytochrome P460 family protein [Acidobacteria bacterium]|nr:cytochrome P460 family protein [Acidobacteriota bacterium]
MRRQLSRTRWFAFLLSVMVAALAVTGAAHLAAQSDVDETATVMPRYDAGGALHLPDDYLRWTFVGASLGLSYNDEPPQRESFNHTLMEPTAYDHFVRTGEFREGTMLVLLVRSTEADAMPARHGRFASDVLAVELAVKDKERVEAGWAYYDFRGAANLLPTAQPQPPGNRCYACHIDHAARDNVFLQFYPLLADAAGVTVD